MKVAFFILSKREPSSRFRVLQYIPRLKESGIKCDVYAPLISKYGVSHRVFPGPSYYLVKHFTQVFFYLPIRFMQIATAPLRFYDAVFIQKPLMQWPPSAFLEDYISKINPKIIFDIDDAVFTSISGECHGRMRQVRKIAALVKVITAGNSYLADEVGSNAKKVVVLPTTVDESRFKPCAQKQTRKVCIGWTGMASNFRYLFDLMPVFEKLQDRHDVKIKIISNLSSISELSHIKNIEFCKWKEETEVEDLQEFDVGLMPLKDDSWTRGKCAFKLIQYMAVGIPSVASPVGANKDVLVDGSTGYFSNTYSQWMNRLDNLISDPDLREQMGSAAREDFLQRFSFTANASSLYAILCEVASG